MYDTSQLAAEFQRIGEDYKVIRAKHDAEVAAMLQRRREIARVLVQDLEMTHREAAVLLGISAGRVGQLLKGAPGYVSRI